MDATVVQLWKRLDTLLLERAEPMYAILKPPAQSADIDALEHTLRLRLPDDARQCYMCHGGQHFQDWNSLAFFPFLYWHDLDRIREDTKFLSTFREEGIAADGNADMWFQPNDSIAAHQCVRFDYWNPKWIPIAKSVTGVRLFIDLAPGPAGRVGQLVVWEQDNNANAQLVVAPSLAAYLSDMADALEHDWLRLSGKEWWDCILNGPSGDKWPRKT
ncbi:SMI1/KNR4 family protein [Cupriavidus sp. UGS-1]|uniref:SMI1/KNR4 family protein n=1 Tax=Cupriavidus sp. UGS-1 TaxID=2899826 RepID=UPI001E4DC434|nr:SMI1/KNR4 family protein [Cupriavidus sp. UGS-1]MCD9120615.1 SMI1/KNR4 family protein [Cupriavidus sp. UGS-1]